jgi:hypothetical protein
VGAGTCAQSKLLRYDSRDRFRRIQGIYWGRAKVEGSQMSGWVIAVIVVVVVVAQAVLVGTPT